MIYDSAAVDEVLLVLKIAFLVLLYLFIWRIVRTASRDLRLPQESFILAPSSQPGVHPAPRGPVTGRLVVMKSPDLDEGTDFELDSAQLTIGRGRQNDISIGTDEYASARHARFEPRQDGVWVQDLGSSNDPNTSGMGTTITVALVEDDRVAFGHVGDSRAYLIRDARIEQLTEDHSLVNELMKSGKLSPQEAETHPQRSVITRALGTDPDIDVDTFSVPAQTGDLFLLCSDGLTDMIEQGAILDLVERNRDSIDNALKSLVKAANRGGGEDNITIVAFEIADVAVHDGQTQEHALPPELQRRAVEDEETLDEMDAVPTVDTMVVTTEEFEDEE